MPPDVDVDAGAPTLALDALPRSALWQGCEQSACTRNSAFVHAAHTMSIKSRCWQDTFAKAFETTGRLQIEPLGDVPPARRAAASCVIDGRWLVVHGGFDGAHCLDDAYVLDTQTRVWSQLAASAGLAAVQPAPRALHTLCPVGHGVVLYGGASGSAAQSSAHLLHSPAVVAGVRLQSDAAEAAQRATSLQCALGHAAAARDNAQRDASRALAESEVRACVFAAQASPSLQVTQTWGPAS